MTTMRLKQLQAADPAAHTSLMRFASPLFALRCSFVIMLIKVELSSQAATKYRDEDQYASKSHPLQCLIVRYESQ